MQQFNLGTIQSILGMLKTTQSPQDQVQQMLKLMSNLGIDINQKKFTKEDLKKLGL